jgi:hypothetical protein
MAQIVNTHDSRITTYRETKEESYELFHKGTRVMTVCFPVFCFDVDSCTDTDDEDRRQVALELAETERRLREERRDADEDAKRLLKDEELFSKYRGLSDDDVLAKATKIDILNTLRRMGRGITNSSTTKREKIIAFLNLERCAKTRAEICQRLRGEIA